jgi:hypothetical protein
MILAKAGVVKGVNRQTLSSMILEEQYETDVLDGRRERST